MRNAFHREDLFENIIAVSPKAATFHHIGVRDSGNSRLWLRVPSRGSRPPQTQQPSFAPVMEPTRQGFGTSLIKGMFSNVRFDFAPDGFSCDIDVLLQPSAPTAISTIRSGNQAQVGS
jgi:hypothetical protein